MARALHKVQKQIAKKRGGKPNALHENSRDARRLRQASAREDKLLKIMTAAQRSNQMYVDRVAWMGETMIERGTPLNDSDLRALIEAYIGREDEELAELQAAQRPGRPKSKVEERIGLRIDSEQKEFEAGFWTPDLRDDDMMDKLKRWSGSWGGLNNLKFVRVTKAGEIKPSSFPPRDSPEILYRDDKS